MESTPVLFYLIIIFCNYNESMKISLKQTKKGRVVYEPETGRSLCYPTKEKFFLGFDIEDDAHHQYGFHNDSYIDVQNIGQVMCRQLYDTEDSTHLERIYSIDKDEQWEAALWSARCLGYEPMLQHCRLVDNSTYPANCSQVVGLECGSCFKTYELRAGHSVEITNPRYPDVYYNQIFCQWIIEAEQPTMFTLDFTKFSLPRSNKVGNCTQGVLSIEHINNDGLTVMIGRYCDSTVPEKLRLQGTSVIINFASGIFHDLPSHTGFKITVTRERNFVRPLTVPETVSIVLGTVLMLIVLVCAVIIVKKCIARRRHRAAMIKRSRRVALKRSPHFISHLQPPTQEAPSRPFGPTQQRLPKVPSLPSLPPITPIYEEFKPKWVDQSYVYLDGRPHHSMDKTDAVHMRDQPPSVKNHSSTEDHLIHFSKNHHELDGDSSTSIQPNSTTLNFASSTLRTPPSIRINNISCIDSSNSDVFTSTNSLKKSYYPTRRKTNRSWTIPDEIPEHKFHPAWQSLIDVNDSSKNQNLPVYQSEPAISNLDKFSAMMAPKLRRASRIFGSDICAYETLGNSPQNNILL